MPRRRLLNCRACGFPPRKAREATAGRTKRGVSSGNIVTARRRKGKPAEPPQPVHEPVPVVGVERRSGTCALVRRVCRIRVGRPSRIQLVENALNISLRISQLHWLANGRVSNQRIELSTQL